mmetsp:Transcript_14169/g.26036  ORF Transcript_14169/g.26036 Transcript_14169/m.26036 type:complete len:212 (+) Transcript_14169:88-723(+)
MIKAALVAAFLILQVHAEEKTPEGGSMVSGALGKVKTVVGGVEDKAGNALADAKVAYRGNVTGTCPKDTGGTCRLEACNADRKAVCKDGLCVCGEGDCAVDGKCVAAPTTPKPTDAPKKNDLGSMVAALTGKSEAYQKEAEKVSKQKTHQDWSIKPAKVGEDQQSGPIVFVSVGAISTLMVAVGVAMVRSGLCRGSVGDEEAAYASGDEIE